MKLFEKLKSIFRTERPDLQHVRFCQSIGCDREAQLCCNTRSQDGTPLEEKMYFCRHCASEILKDNPWVVFYNYDENGII